jgi:ABC-2 type transport system permease protein
VTWLRQLRHQAGFDLLMFRRNPAATFFTVAFPLIFLFIFTGIFGNELLDNGVRVATLYVPGILTLAIVSATMVNAAITMVNRRERGVLKRIRGTPLQPSVFILAHGLASIAISVIMTVLVVAIGWLVFDVSVRWVGAGSLIITLLLGAASFSALGLALTAIIPSESAAPAVTNAIVLPLYFVSDVFIVGDKPEALERIAEVFPIQHLASALHESFDPFTSSAPWPLGHWLVVAAWGLVGGLLALRTFRWTPRR